MSQGREQYLIEVWNQILQYLYSNRNIEPVILDNFYSTCSLYELTEEKARYHADYQRDQAKIRELDRNPKAMEKIARERYFMKTDDEDIFVLRENEDLSSDQTDSNEKAE